MTEPRRVVALLVMSLCASCGKRLSTDECDALLDHYTRQLVLEEHPKTAASEVERRQREARELARQDPGYEFEACPTKVSRRQFHCAMTASSVDQIEQCLIL